VGRKPLRCSFLFSWTETTPPSGLPLPEQRERRGIMRVRKRIAKRHLCPPVSGSGGG
jgi:hypothetical protein